MNDSYECTRHVYVDIRTELYITSLTFHLIVEFEFVLYSILFIMTSNKIEMMNIVLSYST